MAFRKGCARLLFKAGGASFHPVRFDLVRDM